jgi:hypothetical protein
MRRAKITAEQIEDSLARWSKALSSPSIEPEQVPEGWFTVAQLAEKIDRSHCNTGERVRRMVAAGKAEKKLFRIKLEEKVRPVPHYRLK